MSLLLEIAYAASNPARPEVLREWTWKEASYEAGRAPAPIDVISLSLSLSLYTYIYIYTHICLFIIYSADVRASRILRARTLTLLRAFVVEVLRRFTENIVLMFPCKMTDKCCGDSRRRRIRAKAAQRKVKILAREIP